MSNQIKHKNPKSFQVQISRIFGSSFSASIGDEITDHKARLILKRLLDEIAAYTVANVETDRQHYSLLFSGLTSANEALDDPDYFFAYVEGLTRLIFLLLGDYPNHTKIRKGRRRTDHYRLNKRRSLHYLQDDEQKFRTLLAEETIFLGLSSVPKDQLGIFRDQFGSKSNTQ